MIRFQIVLEPDEADALLGLAQSELRDPRDQVRHIVRDELVRRHLLSAHSILPSTCVPEGERIGGMDDEAS
jgi:hypothetical protein